VATSIGRLAVYLNANTRGFNRGLARARRRLASFGENIRKTVYNVGANFESLGKRMLAVSGALHAPLALAARSFANYGDAVAKMARRTGLSTEAVSELGHVAALSGADMDSLEKGVKRMARAISDAESGLMTYVRSFDKVGLSAQELAKLSPEEAFLRIGEAIHRLPSALQKASVAQEIFGRAGTRLLPLFDIGAEGIAHYREEARRLGISLGGETAVAAEKLTDNLTRMKGAWKGLQIVIGNAVAPAFTKLLRYISNVLKLFADYLRKHPRVISAFRQIAKWTGIIGASFVALGASIKVFSRLISPTGFIAAAVAGLIFWSGALDRTIAKWKEAVGNIEIGGVKIREWIKGIGKAWKAMMPIFQASARAILATFGWLWASIKRGFARLWLAIGEGFQRFTYDLAEALGKGGLVSSALADGVRAINRSISRSLYSANEAVLAGEAVATKAAQNMIGAWKAVPEKIKRAFTEIGDVAAPIWVKMQKSPAIQGFKKILAEIRREFREIATKPEISKAVAGLAEAPQPIMPLMPRAPGAYRRGTVEAYAASFRARNQTIQIARQQLRAQQDTKKEIKRLPSAIASAIAGQSPEGLFGFAVATIP